MLWGEVSPVSSLNLEEASALREADAVGRHWRGGTPATSSLYFIRRRIKRFGIIEGRETYPHPFRMADLTRNFSSPSSGEAAPDGPKSLHGVQEQ